MAPGKGSGSVGSATRTVSIKVSPSATVVRPPVYRTIILTPTVGKTNDQKQSILKVISTSNTQCTSVSQSQTSQTVAQKQRADSSQTDGGGSPTPEELNDEGLRCVCSQISSDKTVAICYYCIEVALDPEFTELEKSGDLIVDQVRKASTQEDFEKVKEKLTTWCRTFRRELVRIGLAVTIRNAAKGTISVGANGGHELDYLVYQILSIIDATGGRRGPSVSGSGFATAYAISDVVPQKVGVEPKLPSRTGMEQRERCRWILTYSYHKIGGTQPNEVLRMQHNLSLILRRWLEECKQSQENAVFCQRSPLYQFEAEEQHFRKIHTKLRNKVMRTGTEKDKHNVNCFEADCIACYLFKLEIHFDLSQEVNEEERKLFLSLVAKLNKLDKCFNEMCKENIERWRQIANENVVFAKGSVLHETSLQTERNLQKRVAAELCNMAFVVFSTIYSIALGGHVNSWIDVFGREEIPSWWPTMLVTNSLWALIISTALVWNYCEEDDNSVLPMARDEYVSKDVICNMNKYRRVVVESYFKVTVAIGMKRHFASLVVLVFIVCVATVFLTAGVLRAAAAANLLL